MFCDVLEPLTNEPYERDPRGIAGKAMAYLQQTGAGDTAVFGPEAEFFVFDDVRFAADPFNCGYKIDSIELPTNMDTEYEMGNLGHRPRTKGGYFPVPPIDSAQDLRSEMLSVMADMGVVTEKHHHEVGAAQHELGIKFGPLVKMAELDADLQIRDPQRGAGLRQDRDLHAEAGVRRQRLGHAHPPVDLEGRQADVRRRQIRRPLRHGALHYIGGILKHAKALNAYTNPLTNSYKRLVPGYEAPVLLAYSSRNRSASCRIPLGSGPKAKRVEVRFPDPGANPYLAFAAMLMAGLDGIENKLNPGDPIDKNLYDLPPEELEKVPTVCGSLREACESLDQDRAFLKKGNVFTDDAIDAYLELRMEEVERFEMMPHPIEFDMYYSV